MQSVKTAIIVGLLLAMFYGVYTVINTPPAPPPREIAGLVNEGPELLTVEEGDAGESPADLSSASTLATDVPPASRPKAPTPRPLDDLESRPVVGLDRIGAKETQTPDPPATPDESLPSIPVPDLTGAPDRLAASSVPGGVPNTASRTVDVPETRSEDNQAPSSPPANDANASTARSEQPAPAQPATPPATERKTTATEGASEPAAGRYVEGVRFNSKEAALSRGLAEARQQMSDSKWREALFTLTTIYEDPRLADAERQQLLDRLDPLAAKVIYSTENLVEPPYETQRGDTLVSIAERYQVPWQLLQRINGVKNPDFLVPGTKLKVVRGPFRGEVDLARQEFTLYLNRLYAGRFPISLGSVPEPGDYLVKAKETGHTFFAPDGRPVASDDPNNPFGQVWIDLGRNVSIHGSPAKAEPSNAGSISLSPKDADDVFAILSQGSQVTIRR